MVILVRCRPNFELNACELQSTAATSKPQANGDSDTTVTAPTACYVDDEVLVYAIVTGRSKAGIKRKLNECSLSVNPSDTSSPTLNGDVTTPATKQPQPVTECVSYVVETQPQRGKFLVEKARALGVPKGKLFGQLHQGKDVTLPDGRVVQSQDCVSPTLPATGCAVIACPSLEYLDELVKSSLATNGGGFSRYQFWSQAEDEASATSSSKKPEVQLEVMYHFATEDVLRHPKYVAWVQRFGDDVDHVVLSVPSCPKKSVYRASAKLQAQLQSVFPRAFPSSDHELQDAESPFSRTVGLEFSPKKPVVVGESMLKYTVTPAARRGFDASNCFQRLELDEVRASTAAVTERLGASLESLNENGLSPPASPINKLDVAGRITFLGTGCAIPSKYRNVTGMYLELERPPLSPTVIDEKPEWDGMMLDCGEGSFGQLYRYADGDVTRLRQLVNKLKCIWISHNHADHHLGTVRMLSERSRDSEPLLIIGPTPVEFWLSEYAEIDPTVTGKYRFVDNFVFNDLDARFEEAVAVSKPTRAWLRHELRVTGFECVPVKHAFLSYALVVTFADHFKIAFSGDCRPSDRFASKAKGAFLMVHEATFEDDLGDEAKNKDHCTTGEAIGVGKKAHAKHVVLTHFSQRYPKMPVMEDGTSDVLTAIDMLSLRFDELHQPQLMDVCSELMATGEQEQGDETETSITTAS